MEMQPRFTSGAAVATPRMEARTLSISMTSPSVRCKSAISSGFRKAGLKAYWRRSLSFSCQCEFTTSRIRREMTRNGNGSSPPNGAAAISCSSAIITGEPMSSLPTQSAGFSCTITVGRSNTRPSVAVFNSSNGTGEPFSSMAQTSWEVSGALGFTSVAMAFAATGSRMVQGGMERVLSSRAARPWNTVQSSITSDPAGGGISGSHHWP